MPTVAESIEMAMGVEVVENSCEEIFLLKEREKVEDGELTINRRGVQY